MRQVIAPEKRFFDKVQEGPGGCWLWTGTKTHGGYGQFWGGGARETGRQIYAHRWSYEHLVDAIPEGLELDHLCRVRNCVNPYHLEPVTHRENILRGDTFGAANAAKTHCANGHPLDRTRGGRRACSVCYPPRGVPNGDKTHCKRGHEFTPENTYLEPSGLGRACRTCRSNRSLAAQALRKALTRQT